MRIRLLAFATASDAIGAGEVSLVIDDGTTIDQLRTILAKRYPQLGPLWRRLAVAVDGEVAAGDTLLFEGAEVALLPPVSGGSPTVSGGRPAASPEPDGLLTDRPLDITALVRAAERPDCGAVVLFLGTVRNHHGGRPVSRITYHAYRAMAERRLARIVEDLEQADPTLRARVVHRLGTLEVGESSVAIAVSSPHREAAYAASRTLLERLKAEVPIWKREHYQDGAVAWREEEPLGDEAGD